MNLTLLPSSDDQRFILKEVAEPDFNYYRDIYRDLKSPYLRLLSDTVPEQSLLVFRYFRDHFLRMAPQMDLPIDVTKRILRDVLRGIAALHEQDIVHTGMLANCNFKIRFRRDLIRN